MSESQPAFSRKPKVFIVGVSGLVGYHLARRLVPDFLVTGAYFEHQVFIPNTQFYPVSLKSLELLETVIRMQEPDILINCMGITDRKIVAEQTKLSDNINVLLPVSLAALATKMKSKFVQIGCADQFDGDTGNYTEEDNSYTLDDLMGKQKITAASYIRAQTLESTILRVGCVQGIGHPYRLSAFDRLRIRAARGDKLTADKNRVHAYISTRSFSNAIHALLSAPFPGKHRTYHVAGPAMTEFDLMQGWLRVTGKDSVTVKASADTSKRNTSLNSSLFAKTFPAWKPETKQEFFLNLLADLSPGAGTGKWEKVVKTLGV
ncbi:MAG: sugar nucleotide-binding protein [Bdellovibrionota bacterium]